MNLTYAGAYGRLKVVRENFLQNAFLEKLEQSSNDEFIKLLTGTSYRKEVDELSALYTVPDLVEVVINAHMARMVRTATFGLPPLAKDFIAAYLSKWDIENIKTILSSKVLNYHVENTEVFLVTERGVPVGVFSGMMTREDFKKLIDEKDVEGVVKALLRYGYGTTLLKYMDEAKKGDITAMISSLDLFYFSRLLQSYKPYNSNKDAILNFIRELIDVKNTVMALKARERESKKIAEYAIKGGNMQQNTLEKIATAKADEISALLPFRIDAAMELYRKTSTISHVEVALKRELYKKYLKQFEDSPISLEFILAFIIRTEIERDELRSLWFSKYYRIGKGATEGMQVLKYM